MMIKVDRSAAIYYGLQGLSVFGWWGVLFFVPAARRYFLLDSSSENLLMAFSAADLGFLGIGSLFASVLCWTSNEYRQIAAWLISGAIGYVTIYVLTVAMMTDSGWLGVVLMFPAMIFTGVFAVGMSFNKGMFRRASDASIVWILTKTFAQISVVWSIILVFFPYLITIVENKIGIQQFHFPFQKPISAVLFIVISSLGVWAAIVMSRVGKGTPLPLDHAVNLVIRGPYQYVRNPMAVSGIGQGLAVALFLGSPLVAVYALMGSLIWQFVFRPPEEEDLRARFGEDYVQYCEKVKCWFPCLTPYQMDGTSDSSNSVDSPLGKM